MGQFQPDQGNRYELSGIVGAVPVLAACADLHPDVAVIPLPTAGLGLVPVTPQLLAATPPAHSDAAALHTGPESGFTHLTPALFALLETLSEAGPVGYMEADYTGHDGAQTAAVWQGGEVLLGPLILGRSEVFVPRQAPISQVLRLLGVSGELYRDEFVVAGLGRYRRTEDWL